MHNTKNSEEIKQPLLPVAADSSSVPASQAVLPPQETKSCWSLENVASGWVYYSTFPQGPLGGLLPYLFFEGLVQDDQEKDPGLFYFGITIGLLAAAAMAYLIVKARTKVFAPYAAEGLKKLCSGLPRQPCERKEQKSDAKLLHTDEKTADKSYSHTAYNGVKTLLNIGISANISVVFGGLNILTCDLLGSPLTDSRYRGLRSIGDIIASIPVKASFAWTSLSMNLLLFYYTQGHVIATLQKVAKSAWRYCTEEPHIYASRQQLLSSLDYCRLRLVEYINYQDSIAESVETKQSFLPYSNLPLKRLVQRLQATQVPERVQLKLKTRIRHYVYAGLSWATAIVGLWNFFYSQQLGLQFLLQQFMDEDAAENASTSYLDSGGKYLMILNMGALYFHVIIFNALNFFNSHREIDVNQLLPGQGGWRYWGRVWLMAIVATLPNVSATIPALDSANIPLLSFPGIALFSSALVGPIIMEIFGIDRNYREKAFIAFRDQADPELSNILQAIEGFDIQRQAISDLSASQIQRLDLVARTPLPPSRLAKCLSALFSCCRRPAKGYIINRNDDLLDSRPLYEL